jgi:hypothetical protein
MEGTPRRDACSSRPSGASAPACSSGMVGSGAKPERGVGRLCRLAGLTECEGIERVGGPQCAPGLALFSTPSGVVQRGCERSNVTSGTNGARVEGMGQAGGGTGAAGRGRAGRALAWRDSGGIAGGHQAGALWLGRARAGAAGRAASGGITVLRGGRVSPIEWVPGQARATEKSSMIEK